MCKTCERVPAMLPGIHQRKWEMDSLCSVPTPAPPTATLDTPPVRHHLCVTTCAFMCPCACALILLRSSPPMCTNAPCALH